MEAKEAIKRIEQHNRIHATKEFPFAIKITKALDMAVEALESKIAKKPLTDTLREEGYCACPICNHLVDNISQYCEHCGQKLDWE